MITDYHTIHMYTHTHWIVYTATLLPWLQQNSTCSTQNKPKYRPQFIVSTTNTGIQKHHSSSPVKEFRPLSFSDVCRYTSHRHLKAAQGPQNTLQTSQTVRQPPPLGPKYHSGGDKTHAVRGCNAISPRCAGKSLKVDFRGQQWDTIMAVMAAVCMYPQ